MMWVTDKNAVSFTGKLFKHIYLGQTEMHQARKHLTSNKQIEKCDKHCNIIQVYYGNGPQLLG